MDVKTETSQDWAKDVDTETPLRLSLISGTEYALYLFITKDNKHNQNNTKNFIGLWHNELNLVPQPNNWRERAAFQRSAFGRSTAGNDIVATIFIRIFFFFPFFFLPFFPPSRPFLIEGVLGSKNLFSESWRERPKT